MDNTPPNNYNPAGETDINAHLIANSVHNQNYNQLNKVPQDQLPPGYTVVKQDSNSNTPVRATPPTNAAGHMQSLNNYNQSGNSSPSFNHSGMLPPQPTSLQSSPMRPPIKPPIAMSNQPGAIPFNNTMPLSNVMQNVPTGVPLHQLPQLSLNQPHIQYPNPSPIPRPLVSGSPIANNSPTPYHQNQPPQHLINNNAPPLIPSSQQNQPPVRGPPGSVMPPPLSQYLPSDPYNTPIAVNKPQNSGNSSNINQGLPNQYPAPANPLPLQPGQSIPISAPPMNPPSNGPVRPQIPGMNGPVNNYTPQSVNSDLFGPPMSLPQMRPPQMGPPMSGQPHSGMMNGPGTQQRNIPSQGPVGQQEHASLPSGPTGPPVGIMGLSHTQLGPQKPIGPLSGPMGQPGPMGLQTGPMRPQTGPTRPQTGPMGPQTGPMGPQTRPIGPQTGPIGPQTGPMGLQTGPMGLQTGPMGPQPGLNSGPQSLPMGLPSGPQSLPLLGQQMIPHKSNNMQNRYPQMQQSNYGQPPLQQPSSGVPYPHQYNAQNLTQQMGQMSVTKQGFDQLWGHQMVDLMQCRQILPEYPDDPPEIRLAQFPEAQNCSPEIFRCTVNKIPDTNSLLQKSRLPLGILIYPFKDLNHLPVIQCNTIVRCRACRTYINPFAYFVDNKRWKCNLCYRVNDLPEEFQYDPVSKSYGDPSRRPEIKSATIEFIAPGEYMLRPPQPAVYLFLMDVSQIGLDSGYLKILCSTLLACLDQLPGDARTQVGFICYDAHVHYYLINENLTRPKQVTVLDIDDVFLPSPESLLVNLGEMKERVVELLSVLGSRGASPAAPAASALGAALQAAYKLMSPTGGRITVFQTCLPNVGPGALQPREDPNARSSKEVQHLSPATDFYKRLALDCSGAQVAVDLFLLSSQYSDLATLSGMSKFSGGSIYHIPLFRADRPRQADEFRRMLTRYLTRKIGFEAVMRVRCTRGISIHTFHGNFFVRSTDLLSLPNVSPDLGFGMQLSIDESLSDLQHVCFQAALLYTTSKGERRIRVHTLALPIASNLTEVLHSADQQCIIGLLAKMAVDRCASASMSEAREALMNVAVDSLSAHRLAQNLPSTGASAALLAPAALRLLPLYLGALLKRKAFRTGTSTRLDDRVADMCNMKTWPLSQLLRAVYPELYPIHELEAYAQEEGADPPRLHLTAERINMNGAYLLDDGETMIIYVCHGVSPAFLSEVFGVTSFNQLSDEMTELPKIETDGNELLNAFVDKLNEDRAYASNIMILRDNSPNRGLFTERLVDDRVESAFSYFEFLQHVKSLVK